MALVFWFMTIIAGIDAAAKDCPSYKEVKQKIDAAIAVLDENNGTEKEIVLSLRKIIDGSIESPDLISAWSKIYNDLGGGNWKGVDPKIKAAADVIGSLNKAGCLEAYNQPITQDKIDISKTISTDGSRMKVVESDMSSTRDMAIGDNLDKVRQEIASLRQAQKNKTEGILAVLAIILVFQCLVVYQQLQIKNKI